MKVLKLIVFCVLYCFSSALAQRNYNWQLGHFLNPTLPKGGIDFSSGNPDTFSVFRTMPFFNTNAIICDTSGNLLFYTNGIYIANANHDTLLDSENFNPGSATFNNPVSGLNVIQGALILPYPASDSLYIILHESGENFVANNFLEQQPFNLRYSMVDISLDNGLGGIVPNEKGIILIADTLFTGKMTACRHGNGRDWWVLIHKYDSDIFYRLLITPDTIVVDSIQIGSHILWDYGGQAIFSPDGSKYALVTQYLLVDIFDFDRCTGALSNHVTTFIPDTLNGIYGASISSNNRFLYASSFVKIFQYDLFSSNIPNSVIEVAEWDTVYSPFETKFFLHQLAPDGKIYISTYGGCDVLHVINSPDSLGLACNVLQNELVLPIRNISVPNFPNYNLGILQGSSCDTIVGIPTIPINKLPNLNLFYQPQWQVTTISANNLNGTEGSLEIFDIQGKMVHQEEIQIVNGYYSRNFNMTGIADGMYFVNLVAPGQLLTGKFVKY